MIWILLTCFSIRFAQAEAIELEKIRVCQTCPYRTIREALSAAGQGATVFVERGIYHEGTLILERPISLLGEAGAILDGDGRHQTLEVRRADHVVISGFTIQNTGLSFTADLAGIKVIESKKCVIENNRLLNTTYGVYLENSEGCEVRNNVFQGQAESESSGGNGVHVWYGSSHLIEGNSIGGHRDGIYLEFATGTQVVRNFVSGNIRYGLHFMSSHDTEYRDNTFTRNGAGVAVMYSHNIKMLNNQFVGNSGPAAYGLLMKEVHGGEISRNLFRDNTVGMFLEGSNRSEFHQNVILRNGWALRIMGDCENNRFSQNEFLYNSFDVTTNADHSWNTFENNYWSQYDGYDLNRDGIGDVAYRPVSLSSVILERIDSSYILMNSFFFSVMDAVERALPTLVPEALKDETPLMKPLHLSVGAK